MRALNFMLVTLAAVWTTGCASTHVTNITPSRLPRSANGLYMFEVAFDSNQQTIRESSMKPSVLIDLKSYPMEPALMMKNRWEALVPLPADVKFVNYRFKFDYDYNRFGDPGNNSRLSTAYQLEIEEK